MLSRFDDYPIHQTPDPVATPASSDPDVYERYWFNGYSKSGDIFIGVGAARYPHLDICDGSLSIVIDGEQHAFHASARATEEPSELIAGPFRIDIIEPMASCRVVIEGDHPENDTGFACELTFEGRTGNVEEPRHHFGRGIRRVMDTTRFTQLGRWTGWIEFDGRRIEFGGDSASEPLWGTKDRSWGIRPLAGGDTRGAPARPRKGGLFFLWAPLHFEDICVHYQLFEDWEGRPMFSVGAILPTYETLADLPGVEDPAVRHMRNNEHKLSFASDSRMIDDVQLAFTAIDDGTRYEIDFEKLYTFRMKGIGYTHPEWGHGEWKGEVATGGEKWHLDSVDDTAYENQHVQHIMKVTMGDRTGIGVLEQNILGPYRPYNLEGFITPPSD